MPAELLVDLSRPPADRWQLDSIQLDHARDLAAVYTEGFEVTPLMKGMMVSIARRVTPPDYFVEIESLAAAVDVPLGTGVMGNFYYDALKTVMGCTGFAVETSDGILHARNLDWWTENRLLNDATVVTRFVGGPAGEFLVIGWPGFIGVFSGMAPGRFAITLNAVLSSDPALRALPVVFLIRQVLEEEKSYEEAVDRLSRTEIASDCLLLVSGTEPGERVLIERTPKRFAHLGPEDGVLRVTNDYQKLDVQRKDAKNRVAATSCGRFERISELLMTTPTNMDRCLDYLGDPNVRMEITVQQMAFNAKAGKYSLRIP